MRVKLLEKTIMCRLCWKARACCSWVGTKEWGKKRSHHSVEMSDKEEVVTVEEDTFRVLQVLVEEHRDMLGMLTMVMDLLLEEVKGM